MKYKIIKSTSKQFIGIHFECDTLTVKEIENAINKYGMNIIILNKDERNVYRCLNEHCTLLIKEEE